MTNLCLLRGDVLLRSCPRVILRKVVWRFLNVLETNLLLGISGAVVQFEELHPIKFFFAKENCVGIQVSMHDVLLVDQLKEVNQLQADVYRFYFCEEGRQAFLCPLWPSVFAGVYKTCLNLLVLCWRVLLCSFYKAFLFNLYARLFLFDVLL